MSRGIAWQRPGFMVVRNGNKSNCYFTVINTEDKTHTHIRQSRSKNILETAKFIAHKASAGIMKERYPYFIKLSIFRVMSLEDQTKVLYMMNSKDIEAYYKARPPDAQ